ncbi:MAG: aminotransferase class V-fold PLP-dependent enzyme, partial [Terriglobales bacterium]
MAQSCVYFNHAAASPLATTTRKAMERVLAELNQSGPPLDWQAWLTALDRTRHALARLIGAQARDIAFTKNTSEGLCSVAQGLEWARGDRVVSFECEFPANLYPWLALRPRGVELELLPPAALSDLDRLRQALRGARLLSVSFVQYLSGFRADLEAIGELCHEAGALFVVDAIQGLGAFPVDVRRAGIHALAADGHKWLTGPEGAGFLYVSPELLDQLTPAEVGWLSV